MRANLQIIENKLHNDVTLMERSVLQVEAIMELLEVCLRTTCFQVDKFFQQKDGMAMGKSLSPVVSNIFMEHFEKLALDPAPYKPSLWLRYVDGTFVVWPLGPERLQDFFDHLNSMHWYWECARHQQHFSTFTAPVMKDIVTWMAQREVGVT
ncbi:uncharacterized protein LOC111865932 [Cryptotermes secundus]|uniref:uncharacterized protein LOC111865932 n=1 Tax=Cryptotermes secundus TaxID=105785 RepID=UPI000CD7C54C|nr:uncharacterized protein LOC111865932 [Cryptotermes secundus]